MNQIKNYEKRERHTKCLSSYLTRNKGLEIIARTIMVSHTYTIQKKIQRDNWVYFKNINKQRLKLNKMREQTEQYLLALETELLSNVNRYMIEMSQNWVKKMPYEGGIFLLRDEGVICYVESTSNIQNSLNSFLINRNHELRRRLAMHKLNIGFTGEKTLATEQLPDYFEQEFDNILRDNFELSFIAVTLGRAELLKKIVEKYKPFYNNLNETKSLDKAYSVEEIRKNYEKAYMPWTSKDDDELWRLKKVGNTIDELASVFGRKKGAITSRLAKIELQKGLKY